MVPKAILQRNYLLLLPLAVLLSAAFAYAVPALSAEAESTVGGEIPISGTFDSASVCSDGVAVPSPSDNPGLVSDCRNLLAAQDALRGSASLNWSEDKSITIWQGVSVAGSPSRVTGLDLRSSGLTGTIPAQLGNLSGLTELHLNYNQLTGEIPSELGGLSSLTRLALHNNQLTGEIPAELGNLSILKTLWLDGNQLTGEIPAELGNLSILDSLYLYSNQLSGQIPAELGNLSNLEELYLFNGENEKNNSNRFTGCIPEPLTDVDTHDLDWIDLPLCGYVFPVDAVSVAESAASAQSATYTVALADKPGANVQVTVSSDDTSLVTVTPSTLNFTAANWDVGQPVTVSYAGSDDAIDNDGRSAIVSFTSTSAGAGAVTVTVIDDEADPRVTLHLSPDNIDETGDNNASTVTATLSHASSAETTITVSAGGANGFALSNSRTLTIAAGATDSAGVVTITAEHSTSEDNRSVTVWGAASNTQGASGPASVTLVINGRGEVQCEKAGGTPTLPWSVSDTALAECSVGWVTARRIYYFQAGETGELTINNTTPEGDAWLRLKNSYGLGTNGSNLTGRIPVNGSATAQVTAGKWYALMLLGSADGQTITGELVGEEPEPNLAPGFGATSATRSVAENSAAGANVGAAVSATDPEGDALTYSLGGTDAASFTIVSTGGQLQTAAALDYESKSSYSVTVSVSDGLDTDGNADASADATIDVTINITNVDEAGAVTFDSSAPQVGVALTASLSDPDGSISGATWQWASSGDGSTNWSDVFDVNGAASAGYTPTESDAGRYLRATVNYTDGHGAGKSSRAITANAVPDGDPTVTLHLSPDRIDETGDNNVATVTATLSHPSSAATTVAVYAAGAGFDRSSSHTLTIAAGATDSSGVVTITAEAGASGDNRSVLVWGAASNSQGVSDPASVYLIIHGSGDGQCNLDAGVPVLPWSVSDTALADCSVGWVTARRIYYFQAGETGEITIKNTTPQGDAWLRLKNAHGFGVNGSNLTGRIPVDEQTKAQVVAGQWYALMLLGSADGQIITGNITGAGLN